MSLLPPLILYWLALSPSALALCRVQDLQSEVVPPEGMSWGMSSGKRLYQRAQQSKIYTTHLTPMDWPALHKQSTRCLE